MASGLRGFSPWSLLEAFGGAEHHGREELAQYRTAAYFMVERKRERRDLGAKEQAK